MSDSKSATAVMQKSANSTADGSKSTPGSGTSSATNGTVNGADQATSPYLMAAPVPGGLSPPPYHYKRRK
ncbi:hypothetical protein B0F90DRAFT_1814184 [Multifurca ochricompacta]|uniref:Uncharacterized protein n=1 Tax=Multifurca ochricompacta TaxID=376703 RepID=A0AAD4MAG0_9AGAM|nr:hypothetical protein B0F90DRAFT_1814184 [Multifurca ochricompacta]